MNSGKVKSASILTLITSIFSMGFNGFMWFVVSIFVGLGESLGGSSNNDAKLLTNIMLLVVGFSLIAFILSIVMLVKNSRDTLNKFVLIFFAVVLTFLMIFNIICLIKTLQSWALVLYAIFVLFNLISLMLILAVVFKKTKNNE